MWAKQSTAATLIVGPILDSTGAEYTSAVIGDLSISKNGGTLTAMASAATLTHIANGQYTLVTTTGNLDTLGRAQITCNKSTYQMPTVNLMVVPANVYDSMVLGTDALDVSAIQFAGQTITAAAGVTVPSSIASPTNITSASGITLAATTHTGAVIPTVSAVTGLNASNLDAAVSSRMATYTQPTGFLAATFPGTVASPTNITSATGVTLVAGTGLGNQTANITGTITTVTNLTNAATSGDLTATMKASVNAEVDTALADIHLDHLLATDYDPASKPGVSTALLNELVENDGGVARYTANALEQGPSGGGGVADWTSDERTAIRAILGIPGSGTTPADPTSGILDTIRDKVDAVDDYVDTEVAAIKTVVDAIEVDTQDIQSRLPTALVSGRIDSSVGAMANNVLTASAIASDAITDAKVASDVTIASVTGSVNSVTSGVTVSTNNDKTGYTASTVTDKTGYSLTAGTGLGNQTANITGNLSGSVGSVTGAVGSVTAAVTVGTINADVITASALATDAATEIATAVWATNLEAWPDDQAGSDLYEMLTTITTISGRMPTLHYGVAQAGGASTITLNASASSITDYYVGLAIAITASTGAGQVRTITAYNGTTKVATVDSAWTTNPANGSSFAIIQAAGTSGGGGGTDWTANERTAIRSILGIPASGTTPTDPTVGILDTIRDKTNLITTGTIASSIPVTASGQIDGPLVVGDDYLSANGRAFIWTVALPSAFVIATSTCKFGMEYQDEEGTYSFNVSGTVTDAGSGNVTLTFDVPKATTGTLGPGWYRWSVEIASASGTEVTRVKSSHNKLVEWVEKQT